MQTIEISRKPGRVAKPKHEWWKTLIRFPPGTDERIKAVLLEDEPDQTTFIRLAVERELSRREGEGEAE